MNPFLSALWHYLQRSVFPPLPAEHRPGFARHLAYANWLHALLLAPVVLTMNLLFGLLPEIHYYSAGFWALDAPHLAITALHVFMILFSAVAAVVMLRWRPLENQVGDSRHQFLAMGYASVMLAAVALFSVAEQRLTGSISAYLLGIAGFATLFYTTPRFSFWACIGAFLVLITGSVWLHTDSPAMWHHVFIALNAAVIFWGGSRVVYSLKAANYLQLVRIEEQSRQLATTNAELARANQFKTDLLTSAAHDLRDPLNAISLSAQVLREELPAASLLRPMVSNIDDSARRLGEFVGNLLTDESSAAQPLELSRVATPLPEFVAVIVGQLRPLAEVKSIELHLQIDARAEQAPPALLDQVLFRQVIENLITNAVKFSPVQKHVWIDLVHRPEEGYRLTVRDEGPGLTAEDQTRLFRRYQRLSARPTHGENSTGLGLFIVRQLVSLHGGKVWAESDGPGRGASFIVTVP